MNHSPIVSYVLATTLVLAAGCKRAESSANPAATAAATPALPGAQPAMPAAVVPAVAVAAPAAPPVGPRGPRSLEGGAARGVLELLIDSRRACEQAGYTLSQTNITRTAWDQKFVFTCTRAAELIRVELTGQPTRPNYTAFNASNGEFARTMMRQRRR